MTLAFAGFPVETFKLVPDQRSMIALATIRAECDRRGRCFKDQRFLAAKADIPLGPFNRCVAKLRARGIIALVYRGRRKSAIIAILPAHRWATPEKPAPKASECSTQEWNTSSKARLRKEPPLAPQGGRARPVLNSDREEGDGTPGGAQRYRNRAPRQPRAPRAPRQRSRRQQTTEAFTGAADRLIARLGLDDEPTTAKPAARPALPPPVEIIPPDRHQPRMTVIDAVTGEAIPFTPRPVPQRRRGFSPASDNTEAFHDAAERLIARLGLDSRDRGADQCRAQPLLAG